MLPLDDGSSLETGAGLAGLGEDLLGLAAATGDELSVVLDADFDGDDLQNPQCHDRSDALNTATCTNTQYLLNQPIFLQVSAYPVQQ